MIYTSFARPSVRCIHDQLKYGTPLNFELSRNIPYVMCKWVVLFRSKVKGQCHEATQTSDAKCTLVL